MRTYDLHCHFLESKSSNFREPIRLKLSSIAIFYTVYYDLLPCHFLRVGSKCHLLQLHLYLETAFLGNTLSSLRKFTHMRSILYKDVGMAELIQYFFCIVCLFVCLFFFLTALTLFIKCFNSFTPRSDHFSLQYILTPNHTFRS